MDKERFELGLEKRKTTLGAGILTVGRNHRYETHPKNQRPRCALYTCANGVVGDFTRFSELFSTPRETLAVIVSDFHFNLRASLHLRF